MIPVKIALVVLVLIMLAIIIVGVWYLLFYKVEPAVRYRMQPPDERDLADFDSQLRERERARRKGV